METGSVKLGEVQETLLATLYARAVETKKKHGVLDDPKAVEMVDSIDYDFTNFEGTPTLYPSVLRTLMMDYWVRGFLTANPAGTVVEIGAGLNSRFERVDNGRVHWVDLDMPDAMDLRRKFFSECDRRRMVAASVFDETWVAAVKECPGPYLFVAEGVLLYFAEDSVRRAVDLVAQNFPESRFVFETASQWLVDNQNQPMFKKKVSAQFAWACDDPRELEHWRPGLRLLESRTLVQLPGPLRARLPLLTRCLWPLVRLVLRKRARVCHVNLFSTGPARQAERW